MSIIDNAELLNVELQNKKICRYCLNQDAEILSNVFDEILSSGPLSTQSTAIAAIEISSDDGMPSYICRECRLIFEYCYRFRQMCKKAETLLRQFPLIGVWPEKLNKPRIPAELIRQNSASQASNNGAVQAFNQPNSKPKHILNKTNAKINQNLSPTKKLLNSQVATAVKPFVLKLETDNIQINDDSDTIVLLKEFDDNGTEVTIEDMQEFITTAGNESFIYESDSSPTTQNAKAASNIRQAAIAARSVKRPKLLNKDSIRILNKDANVVLEPRLSKPQVTEDEHGNLAIVTEILDPKAPHEPEPDPTKNVETVETHIFPCPHCERSFPLRQLRDIHMVNHNRERSFKCSSCEKSFFSKYDLQKHEVIHNDDKPFKCVVCNKGFTRSNLLHRHEKSHTDTPKYLCVYCEQEFISKEEMEKHTERHLKNRPFKCRSCNKAFAFKQGLERHEVKHQSQQPYPCLYCEQSFATPSKLQRHLTAHAGKRPYPCKYCKKSFMLSHHLTRHLRAHKQSKSTHKCSVCLKNFKNVEELFYHTFVHSIEETSCVLCGQSFVDEQQGGEHIKAHVENDPHFCEFCEMIFITGDDLSKHKTEAHTEELMTYENESVSQSIEDVKDRQQDNNSGNFSDIDPVISDLIEEMEVDYNESTANETKVSTGQKKTRASPAKMSKKKLNDMQRMENLFGEGEIRIKAEEDELLSLAEDDESEFLDNNEPPTKTRRIVPTYSKTLSPNGKGPNNPAKPKEKIEIQKQEILIAPNTRSQQKLSQKEPQIKTVEVKKLTPQEKLLANLPKSITLRKTGGVVKEESPVIAKKEPNTVTTTNAVTKDKLNAIPNSKLTTTNKKLVQTTLKATMPSQSKGTSSAAPRQEAAVSKTPKTSLLNSKVQINKTAEKTQTSTVKTVRLTKAQVEDLAKQGKLVLKDGNMVVSSGSLSLKAKK